MSSFIAGTLAGAGTFRCESCGFPVALHERDEIPPCPHCGDERFKRASLFSRDREAPVEGLPVEPPEWLAEAREALVEPGDYLAFDDDERVRIVPLQEGFTRVGRSLAAHIRFDDPTVSRRHALIHREDGHAKVLDDRSLNGVFVNGKRVDWCALEDGAQIVIGRFSLHFVSVPEVGAGAAPDVEATPA